MGRLALLLSVSLLAACATAVDEEDAGDIFDDAEVEGDGGLAFDIVTKPDIVVEPDVLVAIDATDASDRPTAPDVVTDDRGGVPGVCASATSCGTCTGLVGCGWCGATSVCVAGTLNGPSGGRCEAGWSWSPLACGTSTDPCASLTNCGACLARSGCGWCGASSRCATANAARTGPAAGTCAGMWAGVALACTVSMDPCATVTNCGGCANGSSCGWCRDTLSCMSGTAVGPSGGRTCGSWAWTRTACRNPADSCDSSGNCATCNLNSGCGWCSDSDSCHRGGSSGPNDRACGSSRWDSKTVDQCRDDNGA